MPKYLVVGELPARLHQTVEAPSKGSARRKAMQGTWWYDDVQYSPVKIVEIEEVKE